LLILPSRCLLPEECSRGTSLDLLRKSGEFLMRHEELDDPAATVFEGI
jgi:hypothetical protein